MANIDRPKKPVTDGDWHPKYIAYRLAVEGQSLQRLCRENTYDRSAASLALRLPWPKMEKLIADAIGVTPQEIWPSRYHENGKPKSGRGERGLGRYKPKDSTGRRAVNVDRRRAA